MNASITSNDENIMNRYNTDWDSIDWTKAWESVNHLQTRIAKAQSNGQTNAVKRLQHLLVNSYYAKCIAVEKVTTNKGKKTPGVDGTIWSTSKQKIEAVENLKSIGYQAKPLRRVFIPKRNGKKRPLSIPTMHDRAMQALYAMALDPVAEVKADLNSYGFRRGRGARDAAKRLYTVLFQKEAAQWIVEGDIRSCFDKINHEWLMENIPMNKRILNEFLKAGYTYQNKMFSTDEGTPQGGIISPILANMTLDGIEKLLDESYRNEWVKTRGKSVSMNPHKIHLVRYADDFVITCNSKEKAEEIVTKLTQFLEERGLELAGEKTLITHIDNGFDFLGYNFKRWEDGKVRVKPSGQSVKRLKEELKRTVVKLKAAKQDALIEALNPKITGWAMYHRNFVSKETFYDIDHYLWIILWKWARGRHPNKGKVWIHGKYWKRSETRWEFRGEESTLTTLGDIKIVRHTNLKREMNPYLNPEYFQKRQGKNRSRKGELCSARAVCGESRTHGSKKGVDEQSSTPIRQRSYKWADFKVSDYLADAPPEVIEGLGNSLFSKITGEDDDYSEAMCNWITAPEFSEYKQPVYLKRSRNLTRTPAGEVRDLRDSYQRLIDMGLIEADPSIHLTWTKESNVRKIGHCSVLMKVISISSVLDTDMIPEFVLDYCLYHELCHMIIGFDPTAKRHGEEFSELEAKFEKRDEAEDWLKRLCMYI